MRKKRHSGNGRASVDSMTYSSEGSPTSAANHSRRSRMHSVSEDCEENQSCSIPGTILAWLNDDSGSSDGESKGKGTAREEQPVDKRKAAVAAMSSFEERPRHSERKTVEVAARAAASAAAMSSTSSGNRADFSQSMSNSSVTWLTGRLSSARVLGVHEKRQLTSAREHEVGKTATRDAVRQSASTDSAVSMQSTAEQAGNVPDASNAKTNPGSSPEEEMQRWLSESEEGFDTGATGGIPGSTGGCSEQGEHQGCLDLGERRKDDCALLGVSR